MDPVKSLGIEEVIGEIIDLQLDSQAISVLEIKEEHVFSRTQIARGHYIFAQANSLAVAVINADVALTATARIRFVRPVRAGRSWLPRHRCAVATAMSAKCVWRRKFKESWSSRQRFA